MRPLVYLIVVVIAAAVSSSAGTDKSPRYQDFSVTNIFKGKPTTVDLSSHAQARRYRTQLRKQAAEGPNFAGHYKNAIWGCGSSCAAFAIIDSQSGRVYFPPELPYVTYTHWAGDDYGLQFRIDSRLLILHGSPQEKPEVGTFYYVWQTNTLSLIRSELKK
ncbi:hypothetical protein [Pedosphaera parvula]|uniref:Lipoprotein n=1 Tax=Pedosphaera parvula (strain Ellin514) TaxID=320771 RepID=B9XT36_PEDPL|nr:hypothetical protein [Pedosphaera parvula]EEF56997.1 conserved hypothetical protein [Pedosphaera parvula Ellin514]